MESYAKVIADSISPDGHRLTTFQVCFRRFVLSEVNTHRVFSRNSASSRAIPVKKQLEAIERDLAYPEAWPVEQKGMQGGAALSMPAQVEARKVWQYASRHAVSSAKELLGLGVHKSVTNRLLEPFMWHTAVITSTAWANFFGLRCNPMAQPEIRVAAEAMKTAYDASTPDKIGPGMWHLPYIDREDITAAEEYLLNETVEGVVSKDRVTKTLVAMSSARCARVSYLTQDGRRSVADDLSLYLRLIEADPMHASPLEHVATPCAWNVNEVEISASPLYTSRIKPGTVSTPVMNLVLPEYGNLLGWHSHRFDMEIERGYQAFS